MALTDYEFYEGLCSGEEIDAAVKKVPTIERYVEQMFPQVQSNTDKLSKIDPSDIASNEVLLELAENVIWLENREGEVTDSAFGSVYSSSADGGMRIKFRDLNKTPRDVASVTIPFAQVSENDSSYGLMPRNTLYEHKMMWDWFSLPVDGELASTHPGRIDPDSASLVIREANRMGAGTGTVYNSQAPRIGFNWKDRWWGQMLFVSNTFKFVRGADDTKWADLQAGVIRGTEIHSSTNNLDTVATAANAAFSALSVTRTATNMRFTFTRGNGETPYYTISPATTTNAGLMAAADKVKVNKIDGIETKTNIVEMGVGRKDDSHSYSFGCEITQGKGVLFKIHYEHGDVPRSLQPRIVCYTKGDGSTIWNQPFRWAYIDQSGWGNPTECVPFFYGQRTPPLKGTGDIYIFMAFADEPETYLDYDMEAYVNLEYAEALLPFDSAQRTLPYGGKFDINMQDVVFADDTIKAASGAGNVKSGESGVPLRFWAKKGKRITSIAFSAENWKPIGQVKNPANGQYTYTISGYNVPTDKGDHPLVEIDWLIEAASKDVSGTIDVTGIAKLSVPFSLHITSGNAMLERITQLENEVAKMKEKLQ